MPYTPPSHRSPVSSVPASPDASRRSSFHSGSRPSLPHSASYLNKHRRSSAVDDGQMGSSDSGPLDDLKGSSVVLGGSLRQSPPLPLDERNFIPTGAIVSPPESASSGSDDDEPPKEIGRDMDALKVLRQAVSQMSHPSSFATKSSSPPLQTNVSRATSQQGVPQFDNTRVNLVSKPLAEYNSTRKLGHARSATESDVRLAKSADNSFAGSEDDAPDDFEGKPQMVRKKSGELVRPALRASRRRPSSMPGTPTFSKAVHFDSHLEHVRHFLQVDRPLAVSAGSSPAENFESDSEYPFRNDSLPKPAPLPFQWQLVTTNFPEDSQLRTAGPVRLEKVWLSGDQKSMVGSVIVANMAFHKQVTCRFTLDYWKTISEVSAEYSHEIRPQERTIGCDRFLFNIKLSDMANLEAKSLFLCIRYTVNGQEFWDNNGSVNYQVDFKKKPSPRGKTGSRGALPWTSNSLPRSGRRQSSGSSSFPSLSIPSPLDAFGRDSDAFNFDQPIHEYLGENGPALRLKTKSSTNLPSDNLNNLASPSGAVFSNRYDFGASLSAAVQAAKDSVSKEQDALYMKRNLPSLPFRPGQSWSELSKANSGRNIDESQSPTSGLGSASYEELVNKYCFFGSKQSSSPSRGGTAKNETRERPQTGNEGGAEEKKISSVSGNSTKSQDVISCVPISAVMSASQSTSLVVRQIDNDQASMPMATGLANSSPSRSPAAGSPKGDDRFHGQQLILPERFPWTSDTQPATAIRG